MDASEPSGLTPSEWLDCAKAARELAELSGGEASASVEEIAAQLALAKAIDAFRERELERARGVPIR